MTAGAGRDVYARLVGAVEEALPGRTVGELVIDLDRVVADGGDG